MGGITIVNQDVFHTFTVSELGVTRDLPAGETTAIEFLASQRGTFQFVCAVPGHTEGGMHGTLHVN